MVMLLVSCHKEGVYNPTKKISRIFSTLSNHYHSEYGDDNYNSGKQLSEVWTWNKKTLDRIDYYSNNTIFSTVYYTYDKNRLVKMRDGDDLYCEYKYDGNYLKEVNVYMDNEMVQSYKITHDKSKWSKIEWNVYSDYYMKSDKGEVLNPLRFVLSDEICQNMKELEKKCYARKGGKGSWMVTYDLTWEKSNVSKMVVTESDGSIYTYTYQYDNKNNPFCGCYGIGAWGDGLEVCDMMSKNNMIKSEEQGPDGYYRNEWDFSYEGKYPISRRHTYSHSGDGYSYSSTQLLEYEYTK